MDQTIPAAEEGEEQVADKLPYKVELSEEGEANLVIKPWNTKKHKGGITCRNTPSHMKEKGIDKREITSQAMLGLQNKEKNNKETTNHTKSNLLMKEKNKWRIPTTQG